MFLRHSARTLMSGLFIQSRLKTAKPRRFSPLYRCAAQGAGFVLAGQRFISGRNRHGANFRICSKTNVPKIAENGQNHCRKLSGRRLTSHLPQEHNKTSLFRQGCFVIDCGRVQAASTRTSGKNCLIVPSTQPCSVEGESGHPRQDPPRRTLSVTSSNETKSTEPP